jgi:hypothetical protein
VSLVAAAVCPHPPLIVPEIAIGAAAETDDLRAACAAAVATLAASGARRLVIVGTDDATREHPVPAHTSFVRWGAPVEVRVGSGPGGPGELPLSLLVGAWLAGDRFDGVTLIGVAADEHPDRCAALTDGHPTDVPWALLVMGDGSACRGLTSPGYDDPRAAPYDDGVASALAGADVDALLGLDPVLSAELKVAGRAPWQVLAGAARAAGHTWRGEVTYDDAPYGVTYLVATWVPA